MSTTEKQQSTLTESNLDFKDVIPGLEQQAGGAPKVSQAPAYVHGPAHDLASRSDNATGPTLDFPHAYEYKPVSTDDTLRDDFTSRCNVAEEPKGNLTKPSTVPDQPSPYNLICLKFVTRVASSVAEFFKINRQDTNQDTAVPGILDVTDAQDLSQESQSQTSELNAKDIGLEQQPRVESERIDQAKEEDLCTTYPEQVTRDTWCTEVDCCGVQSIQQPQDERLTETVTSRSTKELEYKIASLEKQNSELKQTVNSLHQQISVFKRAVNFQHQQISRQIPVLNFQHQQISRQIPVLNFQHQQISWQNPVLNSQHQQISRQNSELNFQYQQISRQNSELKQTVNFQHQQISSQILLIEQLQHQLNGQYQQNFWYQTRNQMLEQNHTQTSENNQNLLDLGELLKQIMANKNLSLTPEQEEVCHEITTLRNDVAHPSDLRRISSHSGFKITIDHLLRDAKITEKQAQVLLGLFDSWNRVCGM